MGKAKEIVKKIPGSRKLFLKMSKLFYSDSTRYWKKRYESGGTSGDGSYGGLALFKAEIINKFVKENNVKNIIEFGCGDGNQLELAKYPSYMGFDVSEIIINSCIKKFYNDNTKSFLFYNPKYISKIDQFLNSDLTLSLDVIYHLTDEILYEEYMHNLFKCSKKFVIIYSTNAILKNEYPHIKHRIFTKFVEINYPNFILKNTIDNKYPKQSSCKFFIYEKNEKY